MQVKINSKRCTVKVQLNAAEVAAIREHFHCKDRPIRYAGAVLLGQGQGWYEAFTDWSPLYGTTKFQQLKTIARKIRIFLANHPDFQAASPSAPVSSDELAIHRNLRKVVVPSLDSLAYVDPVVRAQYRNDYSGIQVESPKPQQHSPRINPPSLASPSKLAALASRFARR